MPERRVRTLDVQIARSGSVRLKQRARGVTTARLSQRARTCSASRSRQRQARAPDRVAALRRVEVRRLADRFLHGKAFIVTTDDEGVIAGARTSPTPG